MTINIRDLQDSQKFRQEIDDHIDIMRRGTPRMNIQQLIQDIADLITELAVDVSRETNPVERQRLLELENGLRQTLVSYQAQVK